MTTTPRLHFDEDIKRVSDFIQLAEKQAADGASTRVINDLHLSAIASSVGAMDAYLCDKYVDCLTTVLRAFANRTWQGNLPSHYAKTPLPAGEVLSTTRIKRPHWSIRMSARKLMERDDMLQISRVENNFNPILPAGNKLWLDFISVLIAKNRKRLTQIVPSDLVGISGEKLTKKHKFAATVFKKRIGSIVQIRHDWIHNCGRPKSSIVDYSPGQAKAMIRDITTFIEELDDHIEKYRLA